MAKDCTTHKASVPGGDFYGMNAILAVHDLAHDLLVNSKGRDYATHLTDLRQLDVFAADLSSFAASVYGAELAATIREAAEGAALALRREWGLADVQQTGDL